jgi:cysteine-rich repeat protein
MRRTALILASAFALPACPSDDTPATGETGSTGDTSTSTSPSTTASTSSTTATTTDPTTAESSSESGAPLPCGNGELDEGEQCDDGNQVDDDECSNECIPPCGLRWEFVAPAEAQIELVAATDDGNVRLAGTSGTSLYHELLDDQGNSLESDTVDVGFVQVPGVPFMAPSDAQGSYLFGDYDLGNGAGARVARFDDTPAVAWDVEPDAAVLDEPFDRGIDLAPDGGVVVSGALTVTDGDDDIWVAKLSAADGSTEWTGTYSGPLVGGFSTDDGGPVAIAGDGSVVVLGLVREGLGLLDATVVAFPDGGGAPAWTNTIRVDAGNEDLYASSIDADDAGNVLVAVQSIVGSTAAFEISRLDPDGTAAWTFTTADLDLDPDFEIEPEQVVFPLVLFAPDGSITIAATVDRGVAGGDLLVLRLSAQGEPLCHAGYQVDEIDGDRAPSQLAVMPDGGAVVSGGGAGSDGSLEWAARFRG